MRRSMAERKSPRLGVYTARITVTLFFALILACPRSGRAQLVNAQWNGGTGNWNAGSPDPGANWNINAVPNNGSPSGVTYNVDIGGAGGQLERLSEHQRDDR